MKFRIVLTALFLLCVSFTFAYEDVKNLSLSAKGIEQLEIDCGAGFLKVHGREGLREIKVEAEIILEGKSEKSAEKFLQEYLKLSLEKRGSRAVLTSGFKSYSSVFSFGNKVINLTVSMPKDMNLDVDDGSGSLTIENIGGDVKIDDGSGSMDIMNIGGNLDVDDGSGQIDVEGVSGDVSIDDGSGSMTIRNIQGSVTVRDGSGSISIDGVEKDVYIPSEGSGSVRIKNVKGKVKY